MLAKVSQNKFFIPQKLYAFLAGCVSPVEHIIRNSLKWSSFNDFLVGLLASSIMINLLALVFPLVLLQIYDRIIPNESYTTLTILVMVVVVSVILETLLKIGRSIVTSWSDARFEHLTSTSAFEKLVKTSISEFQKDGTGVHLERMSTLNTLKDFYGGQAITSLIDLPFVVIFLALIAFLGGALVYIPIIVLGIFIVAIGFLTAQFHDLVEHQRDTQDRRLNFLIEMISGIHVIKSHAMESQMIRRYEKLQQSSAPWDYKLSLKSALALANGVFFSQATLVLVAVFGSIKVIHGDLTIGGLAACTLLAGRVLQPVSKATSLWRRMQSILVAEERLEKVMALKQETVPGLKSFPEIKGDIEVKNLCFSYDDKENIIENLNFSIKKGETVALVGDDFSGKSTLINLLFGLVKPTSGEVLVDGYNIWQHKIDTFRGQVGYLPQVGELVEGTIFDNFTLYDEDFEMKDVEEIAYKLGIDRAIKQFPFGYDTKVGNNAIDFLPKGIKQRIVIARVLLRKSPIILFDEANAGIDLHGDKFVRETLEAMKDDVTLVLVSSRPSILKLADVTIELQNSKNKIV